MVVFRILPDCNPPLILHEGGEKLTQNVKVNKTIGTERHHTYNSYAFVMINSRAMQRP